MPAPSLAHIARRCPDLLLSQTMAQRQPQQDMWIFGYGSLLWRQEFDFVERRAAKVYGWHRALKMWSTVNRGTPQCPGLVFGMLSGGSCQGMVFRIPSSDVPSIMPSLWQREMVNSVYDPKWLACRTEQGEVTALAFTLSRQSPHHTGELEPQEYRRIFEEASGKYGRTLDYAQDTFNELCRLGIYDRALQRLLSYA